MTEAKTMKRKEQIYEALKSYEEELSLLNEVGMVGSFGFKADGDRSQATKTGFAGPQYGLSHVERLMHDFKEKEDAEKAAIPPSNEEIAETTKSLQEEIKRLSAEIESLKNSK